MPKSLSESQLRELLAAELDLVELDLELVKQEYKVKNDLGAGGYIDILARDDTGVFVVIELKRSDQSAREALHELNKYVSLLASDQGVRTDQVRCILLSTNWRELLVPFARFVKQADYTVEGRRLLLDDAGRPFRSEIVLLPAPPSGSEACPYHLAMFYSDTQARDAAVRMVPSRLRELSVDDYIIYELNKSGELGRVIFPHGFVLVLAEFNEAMQQHLWELFPEQDEEEMESDWWFEQLAQGEVVKQANASEVAVLTPANQGAYEGWDIYAITGYGCYDAKLVWPEERLLGILRGVGDSHSMYYESSAGVSHKANWTRMREKLPFVLHDCGDWPKVIDAVLDELEDRQSAKVRVSSYAPADVLLGLDGVGRLGSKEFLPALIVGWKDGRERGLIQGELVWDGSTIVTEPEATMGKVYPDCSDYFFARALGGAAEHETYLAGLHGLSYAIIETITDEEANVIREPMRLTLTKNQLVRTPVEGEIDSISRFAIAHKIYLQRLVATFDANVIRV